MLSHGTNLEAEYPIASRDKPKQSVNQPGIPLCAGIGQTQRGPAAGKFSLGGNERSPLALYTEGIHQPYYVIWQSKPISLS